MKRLICVLTVGLAWTANISNAETVTYDFEFTELSWTQFNGMGFFEATGIAETDTVNATVTFDPSVSIIFPENFSGTEYVYEEYYTPWTSFDLSFGDTSYAALPTDGNPYTSIRVRDGISDGTLDISDRVLLDADFTGSFSTPTPNGYRFSQFLITLFDLDETAFSGVFVPTVDVLNDLPIGRLSIPVYFEGAAVQFFRASQVTVSVVPPFCNDRDVPPTSGGKPPGCRPPDQSHRPEIIVNPLPPSLALFLGGLGALGLFARRRRSG